MPFPPPGELPDPGLKPMSPALAGGFFTTGATRDDFTLTLTCVMGLFNRRLGCFFSPSVFSLEAKQLFSPCLLTP